MINTSTEALIEMISKGESQTVEFKTRLPPDHITAAILTAFANTEGGVLIIGVSDKGEVLGLSDNEVAEIGSELSKLVTSLFRSLSTTVGYQDLSGKKIMYVSIQKAPSHLTPITTSTGDVYIRSGAQNINLRSATKHALAEIMSRNPAHNFSHSISSYLKDISEERSPLPPNINCRIFIAMSFREEQEPSLVDYYRAMQRAVNKAELPVQLVRMDLVEGDYEISQQIMDEIDKADIVLVDFTLNPANVYFELGYARGRNKRIIQTARKETNLEFDVRNWRTIFYRNATELEEKLVPEINTAYNEISNSKVKQ